MTQVKTIQKAFVQGQSYGGKRGAHVLVDTRALRRKRARKLVKQLRRR